ncbi:MAG: hypothetical protein IBX56_01185 [Methylomicrobium sp.]|nr:hypothetical protein [Methylomicrobium sp.]
MSNWSLKIEGKGEDEFITMRLSCQIPKKLTKAIVKAVVGLSSAGAIVAVIQHYLH